MKTRWMFVWMGVVLAAATFVPATGSGDPPPVPLYRPEFSEVSQFYPLMEPHGTWLHVAPYGSVWRPAVSLTVSGWRPYAHGGRWVWTDDGWYWHSDYAWGWAPFHYGRWLLTSHYGWVWVPGLTWAPAWVHWRYSTYHVGWAPLPPEAVFVEGRFRYGGAYVAAGFDFGLRADHYVFVPGDAFLNPGLPEYAIAAAVAMTVFARSSVVRDTYVWLDKRVVHRGLPRQYVVDAVKKPVPLHPFVRHDKPFGMGPRDVVLGSPHGKPLLPGVKGPAFVGGHPVHPVDKGRIGPGPAVVPGKGLGHGKSTPGAEYWRVAPPGAHVKGGLPSGPASVGKRAAPAAPPHAQPFAAPPGGKGGFVPPPGAAVGKSGSVPPPGAAVGKSGSVPPPGAAVGKGGPVPAPGGRSPGPETMPVPDTPGFGGAAIGR